MTYETEVEATDQVSDSLEADEDSEDVAEEALALKIKRSDFWSAARRG